MRRIKQLNIEVFGGCNFSCQMCPQSKASGGRERCFLKTLPFDIFTKVIEDAMQYGLEAISLHGSGEPTGHKDLIRMVEFLESRNLHSSFFTNGLRLDGTMFEKLVRTGIKLVTVSIVGGDRIAYKQWMNKDAFDQVLENLRECSEVIKQHPGKGVFRTRHLITTNPADFQSQEAWRKGIEEEVNLYRQNIVDPLNCTAEIWMMHNWAGGKDAGYVRLDHAVNKTLRSCGRPFAETLEVRAGGLGDHFAAVVPCPFVLGKDSQAVLGHLDTQTIAEVLGDEPLLQLQRAHKEQRFADIPYCSGCDMLVDNQEVLAWTNVEGRFVGQSMTSSVVYPEAALQQTG
jgi:organic radical activating enzyme